MAALNFPNNPAVNDTYFANDTTWQFNGSSWVRINTGVQGVTGVQGTQGTQGTQGIQGTNGVQGTDGTQGTQGAQGFNGTLGSQGTQGSQGIQGLQGPSFSRANYSFTATSGQTTFNVSYVVGSNIDVYVNGAHLGPSDYTATNGTDIVLNDPLNSGDSVEISTYTSGGPQGTQGVTGAGTQGTQGTQGAQGIQASQGTDGTQGTQGAQGFNGTLGSQGTQGIQGATGSQGTQGATGTQGVQGTIGNIFWATSAAGISTTSEVGINTTGLPSSLTGVGNSFQGLYISNGMVIHDNVLNGDHYIGTAFNGLMAGPVTINGTLTVDGNYVVV